MHDDLCNCESDELCPIRQGISKGDAIQQFETGQAPAEGLDGAFSSGPMEALAVEHQLEQRPNHDDDAWDNLVELCSLPSTPRSGKSVSFSDPPDEMPVHPLPRRESPKKRGREDEERGEERDEKMAELEKKLKLQNERDEDTRKQLEKTQRELKLQNELLQKVLTQLVDRNPVFPPDHVFSSASKAGFETNVGNINEVI